MSSSPRQAPSTLPPAPATADMGLVSHPAEALGELPPEALDELLASDFARHEAPQPQAPSDIHQRWTKYWEDDQFIVASPNNGNAVSSTALIGPFTEKNVDPLMAEATQQIASPATRPEETAVRAPQEAPSAGSVHEPAGIPVDTAQETPAETSIATKPFMQLESQAGQVVVTDDKYADKSSLHGEQNAPAIIPPIAPNPKRQQRPATPTCPPPLLPSGSQSAAPEPPQEADVWRGTSGFREEGTKSIEATHDQSSPTVVHHSSEDKHVWNGDLRSNAQGTGLSEQAQIVQLQAGGDEKK